MNLKWLKKVRVLISLTFFLGITVLFLDLGFSIPEKLAGAALYFQFVPSLLKFLSVGTLACAGFLFVLALTLLFGRAYCSFLCPLGVFQDIIGYVRKKIKKIRYRYEPPHAKVRYGILLACTGIFLSGSVIGLTLLDPYSNFGRILAQMVRPIVVEINNILVFSLAKINVYAVYPAEFKGVSFWPFIFSGTLFGLVLWMSLTYGRLYCNTVCPVGTLLGMLSRFSLFKIRFNPAECIGCKACEKICKSGCIQLDQKSVDFSRCVACYNCLQVCPTSGVEYQWGAQKPLQAPKPDRRKREFMQQAAAFLLTSGSTVLAVQQPVEIYKESTVQVIRNAAVCPPGALSLENFNKKCTACHLCVTACPTQVLQPAFLEYGLLGIMQPRMDYKTSFCNYDCVVCSSVCPSGAILEQDLVTKKRIQIGRAKFIQKNCVVYSQKTDCGACAEHCPTKAVRMVLDPEIGKRAPKIDETLCVGCGACEYACPTKPHKSIYVESSPVHGVAQKPKEEKIKEEVNLKEDFPF